VHPTVVLEERLLDQKQVSEIDRQPLSPGGRDQNADLTIKEIRNDSSSLIDEEQFRFSSGQSQPQSSGDSDGDGNGSDTMCNDADKTSSPRPSTSASSLMRDMEITEDADCGSNISELMGADL
jgi:hypothetical protein